MLDDTLAEGIPTLGAAAASLRACEGFPRPFGQGSAARAVHRDRACAGRRARRMRFPPARRPGNAAQRVSRARRHRGRQRFATRRRHNASPRRRSDRREHRRCHERARHAAFSQDRRAARARRRRMRIFDEVDHMVVETLEGQAMELGWVRDNDLTVSDGRLSAARAEEDRLVQLHSPDADRRACRQWRRQQSRPVRSLRLSARGWRSRSPTTF